MDIWDILDLIEEGIKGHWKIILVFFILVVLGISGALYLAIDQVEEAQDQTKQEVSNGIVSSFSDTGKAMAEDVEDPTLKGIIWGGMVFAGILLVIAIFVRIGEAFKPLIEALNPINIAKSFGR